MDLSDRYLLFIEYFNKMKFMSAQTTLDEIWIKDESENKDFYGGLIQISVAMYHLTNENPRGAQKIYARAKELVSGYGKMHLGLNLENLLQRLDKLFDQEIDDEELSPELLKQIPPMDFDQNFIKSM